jgi:hypothetical protein
MRAGAQGAKDGGLEPAEAAVSRRRARKRGAESASLEPVAAQVAVKNSNLNEQETAAEEKLRRQRGKVLVKWLKAQGQESLADLQAMKPQQLQQALTQLQISRAVSPPAAAMEDEVQQGPPA